MNLDDAWNKDLLPHQGRHPNEYHEYILDSMKQFDDIAQGDKDIFQKLFDGLKENVKITQICSIKIIGNRRWWNEIL